MPETEGNSTRPPRFPFVAAVFCAACVGAAAWTWMRYSYHWDATVEGLLQSCRSGQCPDGAYVRLRGFDGFAPGLCPDGEALSLFREDYYPGQRRSARLFVSDYEPVMPGASGYHEIDGRIHIEEQSILVVCPPSPAVTPCTEYDITLSAAASRWHPASVSGLVVGAMGVFVFAVALRHWLKKRRAFREATMSGTER